MLDFNLLDDVYPYLVNLWNKIGLFGAKAIFYELTNLDPTYRQSILKQLQEGEENVN